MPSGEFYPQGGIRFYKRMETGEKGMNNCGVENESGAHLSVLPARSRWQVGE